MSNILTKATVLVLNRNWQVINVRTPQEAFCMMATNVATGLEIERGDGARAEALRPVRWEEWITPVSRTVACIPTSLTAPKGTISFRE